jgi:hypothetical protein
MLEERTSVGSVRYSFADIVLDRYGEQPLLSWNMAGNESTVESGMSSNDVEK